MADISKLIVQLIADSKGFKKGMGEAGNSLTGFERSVKRVAGAARLAFGGLLAGLSVKALDDVARKAISAGDNLAKFADATGVSIETLQELRFASERAGGGADELDKSLLRFTKTIGEAKAGTGTLVEILKNIDPKLLGKLLDAQTTDEALDIILDKLKNTESVFDRNAIAAAAFGRTAGKAMASLAVDVDEVRQLLRDMGGVMGGELARKAEIADDKLTDLDTVLKTKLAVAVLDNIEGFIQFKIAMNDAGLFAIDFAARIGKASEAIKRFFDQLPGADIRGDARVEDLLARRKALFDKIEAQVKRADALSGAGNSIFPGINQANARNLEDAKAQIGALAEELRNLDAQIVKRRGATPAGKGSPSDAPAKGSPSDAPAIDIVKADTTIPPIIGELEEKLKNAFAVIARSVEETRTPLEELRAKLAEIEAARPFANTAIDLQAVDLAAAATRKAIDDLDDKMTSFRLAGEAAGRGIADAFAGAIVFGDKLGQSLKRLTQQLAFDALRGLILRSLPAAFGGGKAGGGRIGPNVATLVGERGPEIIVPTRTATIINGADSRRAIGGASVVVNQTIAPNFAGNAATQDDLRLMGQITREAAIAGTMAALRRPRFA